MVMSRAERCGERIGKAKREGRGKVGRETREEENLSNRNNSFHGNILSSLALLS